MSKEIENKNKREVDMTILNITFLVTHTQKITQDYDR